MLAVLCSVVVNSLQAFAGGADRKSFSPMDFLPDWGGERPKKKEPSVQSLEDMKAALRQIASAGPKKGKGDSPKVPLASKVPMKRRKAK